MKTKQSVKLIYASPLWLISNGIHYSHDNHDKSDTDIETCNKLKTWQEQVEFIGEKDYDLIKRVAFNMLHLSTSEHSMFIFYVNDSELEDKLQKTSFVSYEEGSHLYTMNMRTLYENKYWFRKLIYSIYEAGFIKVVDLLTKRVTCKINDMYEIWDCGNVVKVAKKNKRDKYKVPLLLNPFIDKYGYVEYSIRHRNAYKHKTIHRLIAENFIHNSDPKNKIEVNHINGNKKDARIENLEWVTPSENEQHSYDVLGKQVWNKGISLPSGYDYKGKIRTVYQIEPSDNTIVKIWFNPTIAEKESDGEYTIKMISAVCKDKCKTHKGYVWRYAKEHDTYKEGDIYED